jgi:hypothetical protein
MKRAAKVSPPRIEPHPAVPLLAIFKIFCDRVDPLKPVGHIIGA